MFGWKSYSLQAGPALGLFLCGQQAKSGFHLFKELKDKRRLCNRDTHALQGLD